jgi:16S rRNA (cytosine967-C5)-methyltransferase
VEAIPQFAKGWFEVQDLGSQVAAARRGRREGQAGARPLRRGRRQDAGAGGGDGNTGQIYAYDIDPRR